MKKLILFLSAVILLLFSSVSACAVDVFVNGVKVNYDNKSGIPFIDENNRTLVPLRTTVEALGAEVIWDDEAKCAIVKKGVTTVDCFIGEDLIYRNSAHIHNDTAAVIKNSRTYLPIRVVAEALGATVQWNGNVIITTNDSEAVVNSIENSGSHVANLWKSWETALSFKNKGDYQTAVNKIKELAPDFIAAHDGNSNAMLYKHLGECYSELKKFDEASACFEREAYYWTKVNKTEEARNALRKSDLTKPTLQIYAKTSNKNLRSAKFFGEKLEPLNGIYIGAYAEGDSAVHNPSSMKKFYMNKFPDLVGKDMAGYILYMPSDKPLSHYASHIKVAKEKNKIIQFAIEPVDLYSTQPGDKTYIQLAKDMEASGAKILLRFASEMNEVSCPWYTSDPQKYIDKFRIVADIFHKYAPSVPVVWSPNFYPADTIDDYYPGDKYVDYVGISSYMNYQPETDPMNKGVDRSRWSQQLDVICSLYGHKKPIIVSEGGASYIDYRTGKDVTDFAARQLLDFYTYLPIKYPQVKAVFIFDNDTSHHNFLLSENNQYLEAYKKGISNELYLETPDENASLPHYYELATNVEVEAKVREICSFINTPDNDISYVVYNIYGTDVATAYGIPYKVKIDFTYYKGKTIPLKTMAFNSNGKKVAEKTYYIKVV